MTPTAADLAHVLPRGTRVNSRGHLELGGCDALELVAEFGTPAYIVVEDDLRARASEVVSALAARHPDSEVLFASKAFPCSAVIRTLAEEGLGCDVASGGELATALRAGVDPARIYLHGNARTREEFEQALSAGVGAIVLDSFDDIARLGELAAARSAHHTTPTNRPPTNRPPTDHPDTNHPTNNHPTHPQRVLARIAPDVAGDTHHAISTGQADTKFGFSLGEARAAIARIAGQPGLELIGLHCHIGSQLFDLDPVAEAIAAVSELGDFPVLNVGGGLAAAYTAGDRPPAIERWVDAIVTAVHAAGGAGRRLVLEPGRALTANCAVTLYTVQTVKRNVSTWVAVDGGMSDNLRPMLYDARYEALVADRPEQPGGEACRLAGKHCESGDVIVRDVRLPDPHPGDVIATPATGAYGYALANNYNGALRPPVVFCRDGDARLVVRRETYADLTARDA